MIPVMMNARLPTADTPGSLPSMCLHPVKTLTRYLVPGTLFSWHYCLLPATLDMDLILHVIPVKPRNLTDRVKYW